ncbi:MAG: T9SS type A sorting domain-containing protein [Ignavibacteriae bacterium]|nr:T9SS type A sorting domain-containing protein [Ignavibacteriota bacterium]
MINDAAPLSFSVEGPAWLSIDSTGTLTGIPPRAAEDSVLVIVTDSRGASDSLRFRIVARGTVAPDVPADYVMFQNYPNPFNPATTIRFGLPEPSRVHAEVFNILGQLVATIFSSDLHEGYHTVQWSPVGLASGAYIIVLEAHGLVSAGRDARIIKKVSLVR